MVFRCERKGGCGFIKIDGPMTVNEAAALRDELVEGFKSYDGIILDLDAVSECDVAAVQLLCSARLTAENMRKSFRVSGASMSSMDAIARAGLKPDTILGSVGGE